MMSELWPPWPCPLTTLLTLTVMITNGFVEEPRAWHSVTLPLTLSSVHLPFFGIGVVVPGQKTGGLQSASVACPPLTCLQSSGTSVPQGLFAAVGVQLGDGVGDEVGDGVGLGAVPPVCAGLPRPIAWLRSRSYPALPSVALGACPGRFLLPALPTQPAQGWPFRLPPPLPLSD